MLTLVALAALAVLLCHMTERKRNLKELDDLRRRVPHVSHSALAAIIGELKRVGIPHCARRQDIREARDLKVSDRTPYGKIITEYELQNVCGTSTSKLVLAHPVALLWTVYSNCNAFADFLECRLAANPCTMARPWNMILYVDEVHPGDVLGGKKARKFHAMYWSFKEFGPLALSQEDLWFTLTTTRSMSIANVAGGMAAVFGTILKELFVTSDISTVGFVINRNGRSHRLYVKLGFFVMDGAAHKFTWHCKGDAGSKLCILCRNMFSATSMISEEDGTEQLRCNVTKHADLDLASSEDLRGSVRRLEAYRMTDAPGVFERRQMALGFNWQPYNMLSDTLLDAHLSVVEQFLHDWMHMIFVAGVWNNVMNLVLEAIRLEISGNIYTLLKGYLTMWRWPHLVKARKLEELFSPEKRATNAKACQFKCKASEGLSIYAIIAHYFQVTLIVAGKCVAEVEAYIALCDVIDCMVAAQRALVDADTVAKAVESFLQKFALAFGMEWSTPKFHWMLHFRDHVRRYEWLVACWPLERKHRIPKRYGTDILNTIRYERSLLHEVICHHMYSLDNPETFDFTRVGLVNSREAPAKVKAYVLDALALPADTVLNCQYASRCHANLLVWCDVGDVVMYEEDGEVKAGELWANLCIDGELVCVINEWELNCQFAGAATYRVDDDAIKMVLAENIKYTCIWAPVSDTEAKVLMPRQYC